MIQQSWFRHVALLVKTENQPASHPMTQKTASGPKKQHQGADMCPSTRPASENLHGRHATDKAPNLGDMLERIIGCCFCNCKTL